MNLLSMSSIEANTEIVAKGAATTRMNLIKFQYEWTILNFSFYDYKTGEALLSPIFSMGSRGEYKWRLMVYPNGFNDEAAGNVSVFLRYQPSDKVDLHEDVEAKFKFSISNHRSEMVNIKGLTGHTFIEEELDWGYHKFISRKFLLDAANGLLPTDSFMLVCDIIVVGDISATENIHPAGLEVSKYSLPDGFGDLFKSSRLCDVTFVACGREFRAHKAILAARSPVFSAMFEHEMKEQQENRVEITDVDDEVLNEMLWFIYTGKISNLDKMADGLLAVADKYELGELKLLCEKELGESLSIGNAATRFIIADLYGADRLKAQSLNFILTHAKEVSETESYKSMVTTHPHLINEAFLTLAMKNIDMNVSTPATSN